MCLSLTCSYTMGCHAIGFNVLLKDTSTCGRRGLLSPPFLDTQCVFSGSVCPSRFLIASALILSVIYGCVCVCVCVAEVLISSAFLTDRLIVGFLLSFSLSHTHTHTHCLIHKDTDLNTHKHAHTPALHTSRNDDPLLVCMCVCVCACACVCNSPAITGFSTDLLDM